MSPQPFYRQVICTKALGGKHPLWHAHLRTELVEYAVDRLAPLCTGAGNTADNAIRDLAVQLKARERNRKEHESNITDALANMGKIFCDGPTHKP